MRARALTVALLTALGTLLAGCGSSPRVPPPATASPPPGSVVLHVAGSEMTDPLYEELGSALQRRRITLDYQVETAPRLRAGGGAADVPLIAATSIGDADPRSGGSTLYVPVAFTAVAVVYNLPALRRPIRLSGAALAEIFSGRIARWDARAIARSNPGVRLPSTPITIVHRSDASVATSLLTHFLAAASPSWRRTLGSGATIQWPAGTAVDGEAGLISIVRSTPGAIGYVTQPTLLQDRLRAAEIRDRAGRYVAPSLAATSAVGGQPVRPGNLRLATIDAPGRDAYPIAGESYAMTFADPCSAGFDEGESASVVRSLRFLTGGAGQRLVARLDLAPLPARLSRAAHAEISRLRCGGAVPLGV